MGQDKEDTGLLREMANAAQKYVASFAWSQPIASMQLAFGIGGVIALFLVEFEREIAKMDKRLWIVVGDVPSAYLVVEPRDSAREALERYCRLTHDWAEAVLRSGNMQDVFPVDAPATDANAKSLQSRLDFIRTDLLPQASGEELPSHPACEANGRQNLL